MGMEHLPFDSRDTMFKPDCKRVVAMIRDKLVLQQLCRPAYMVAKVISSSRVGVWADV